MSYRTIIVKKKIFLCAMIVASYQYCHVGKSRNFLSVVLTSSVCQHGIRNDVLKKSKTVKLSASVIQQDKSTCYTLRTETDLSLEHLYLDLSSHVTNWIRKLD